jgi:hypothetical protein
MFTLESNNFSSLYLSLCHTHKQTHTFYVHTLCRFFFILFFVLLHHLFFALYFLLFLSFLFLSFHPLLHIATSFFFLFSLYTFSFFHCFFFLSMPVLLFKLSFYFLWRPKMSKNAFPFIDVVLQFNHLITNTEKLIIWTTIWTKKH